jgi:hypothetical protein
MPLLVVANSEDKDAGLEKRTVSDELSWIAAFGSTSDSACAQTRPLT